MALLCVRLGLNQIVIGIGLTLGLEGLTALLHHFQFSRSYPRLPAAEPRPFPCCPTFRSRARAVQAPPAASTWPSLLVVVMATSTAARNSA